MPFSAKKIAVLLASPTPLFVLLPWFMLLLLVGTIAQRYIGLIEAQRLFFTSWVVWVGPVPTPGGITTLAVITVNLLARLLWFSPWQKDKIGVILSHLAILMLLLGGGVTWLTNQEGYVSLLEGESAAVMQDYYERELRITRKGKLLLRWPEAVLQEGGTLTDESLPFAIHLDEFCSNCGTYVQEEPKGKHGIARQILLQDAPAAKEKEENKAGLTFTVTGAGEKQDGGYIAYELLPSQAPKVNGYRIEIARKSLPLPFTIRLLDFEKIRYPGSDQAQEYTSLVEIVDGTKRWQQTIAMNEPLRYRGYALYQSSFLRMGEREASVLAVVKNDGWLLPYIATFLLAIGLIWQCLIKREARI